ncbi:ATP-binding cassette domain-containing protein [Miniphocaeibacter massiliensis]|uniref:ATP-binding cassette domain-containing protein n=1 Tax=Miniphocaeibacter massiliensis TaxID=2041841 RepID=UPI000C1B8A60|nr:excinuclease ABC subunit UvrA [Miniphocaeibacter massiliensis]
MGQDYILISGAREKNLKNVTVRIPKKKITVFTGVSGSGKSSLVFDTIGAESQRQLNETYSSYIRNRLPYYGEPDVDKIESLPVSFVINQKRMGGNARSTVGTITDIYSMLRLLYSRMGNPFVGYSDVFSFNNPKGMCERCGGIGKVKTIDVDALIDKDKSLNEGAILFPGFGVNSWRISRYIDSGLFDNSKKLRDFSKEELDLLLYENNYKLKNQAPSYPKSGVYEGIIPRIERSFLREESREGKNYRKEISKIVTKGVCPVCEGKRLNNLILSCKVEGKDISDCTAMQIDELFKFMCSIHSPTLKTVIDTIKQSLEQMISVGLGYLSLDRETVTLSGGESQRIKIVKQLGSSLSDVLYIFDEPSIGLHPYNIDKINNLLKLLRDKGNTVFIVEHDPDIIKIADHVVDMGPFAGTRGGEVVFEGSYDELKGANTLTARNLFNKVHFKSSIRKAKGYIEVKNATLHNLKNVSVKIPKGVLTVVTGVAGSGKSTLVNEELVRQYPDCININQKEVHVSKRSNIATFSGIFDYIRKLFAKENHVKSSLFSYNSEGACPVCKGLGKVYIELAFMDTVSTKCDACEGKRYKDEVLKYEYCGKNIDEVLRMTVEEARKFFVDTRISDVLGRLEEVGIGYITLGQSLDTLSGGELQRLKLSSELKMKGNLYVIDEPTTGLHISDIERLMKVLDCLVDKGNTVIVIEHSMDVITKADWVIDMGLGAGQDGGEVIFEGIPCDIIESKSSLTGKYLKKYMLDKNILKNK